MARSLVALGNVIAAVSAASLLGIGVGTLVAPRKLADGYGIPASDAATIAYVRGLGMRDAAIGLMILAYLIRGNREALKAAVGCSAIVAVADFALVATFGAPGAPARLAVHGSGTLALVAAFGMLRSPE